MALKSVGMTVAQQLLWRRLRLQVRLRLRLARQPATSTTAALASATSPPPPPPLRAARHTVSPTAPTTSRAPLLRCAIELASPQQQGSHQQQRKHSQDYEQHTQLKSPQCLSRLCNYTPTPALPLTAILRASPRVSILQLDAPPSSPASRTPAPSPPTPTAIARMVPAVVGAGVMCRSCRGKHAGGGGVGGVVVVAVVAVAVAVAVAAVAMVVLDARRHNRCGSGGSKDSARKCTNNGSIRGGGRRGHSSGSCVWCGDRNRRGRCCGNGGRRDGGSRGSSGGNGNCGCLGHRC